MKPGNCQMLRTLHLPPLKMKSQSKNFFKSKFQQSKLFCRYVCNTVTKINTHYMQEG